MNFGRGFNPKINTLESLLTLCQKLLFLVFLMAINFTSSSGRSTSGDNSTLGCSGETSHPNTLKSGEYTAWCNGTAKDRTLICCGYRTSNGTQWSKAYEWKSYCCPSNNSSWYESCCRCKNFKKGKKKLIVAMSFIFRKALQNIWDFNTINFYWIRIAKAIFCNFWCTKFNVGLNIWCTVVSMEYLGYL